MSDATREQEELRAALLAEFKPKGPVEMTVFDQLAHSAWVLQRLDRMKLQAADRKAQGALARLERFRAHHRRLYEKSLESLRRLQRERAAKTGRAPAGTRTGDRRRPQVDLTRMRPATDLIQ